MPLTNTPRRRFVVGLVLLAGCLASVAAPAAADPVVMAAGDIACANSGSSTPGSCSHPYTAGLLTAQKNSAEGLAAVLAVGDLQYEDGTLSEFKSYFDPTWGKLGSLLRPALGNHEYNTPGAAGYFDYFASKGISVGARSEGWYSFDIGTWHFVALNSSDGCIRVKCNKGSPQELWLRNDLASTRQSCIVAYWHHPLASAPALKDLWQDLYDAGADIVFVGHNHTYKKPVARNASGASDPNGPREWVVGTGGNSGGIYGVLKLTLHANSFDWRFVGSGTSDSGSATCKGSPLPPPGGGSPPSASFTFSPASPAVNEGVTFTSTSTDPDDDITSTSWDLNGDGAYGDASGTTVTAAFSSAGPHQVGLKVTDGGGRAASTTRTVTVADAAPPPAGGPAAIADAKVRSDSPGSNYGTASDLRVKTSSSSTWRSYLKFQTPDLSGPVTGAKLRLKVTTPSSNVLGVYRVDSGWSETGVTWSNAPALGTQVASVNGVTTGTVDIPLDVAKIGFVAKTTYAFALASNGSTSSYYCSREGCSGGSPPQLILTTGGTAPPPSPLPPPPPAPPPPPPAGLMVKVLDDAQVKSTSATTNYGSQPTLRVREGASSTDTFYRSYIKLQVTGLSGTVTNVKLRLKVDGNSGSESKDSGDVYLLTDNGWSESTLKWSNRPAITGTPVGRAVNAPRGATIDIDLGTSIKADGTYTLALASHSTDSVIYRSKEGSATPATLIFSTG